MLTALAKPPNSVASPTASMHRLRRGLPGYLILFAPHAVVAQSQEYARKLPSPWVFRLISMNFTSTPVIPPSSHTFKPSSFKCNSHVERGAFTPNLNSLLPTLYAQ